LVEAYFWTLSIVWCQINQKLLDQELKTPKKPTIKFVCVCSGLLYYVFLGGGGFGVFSFWSNNLWFILHQTMDKVQKYPSTNVRKMAVLHFGALHWPCSSFIADSKPSCKAITLQVTLDI
jgi:hypothetical protein